MKKRLLSLLVFLTAVLACWGQSENASASLDMLRHYTSSDFNALFQLAKSGNPTAENALGTAYLFGTGQQQDDAKAMAWFQRAANHHLASAQNNIGVMYQRGRGRSIIRDQAEAAKWFRKSAENGNIRGQYNLGHALLHGEGVPQNCEEAMKWLMVAAIKGDAAAQSDLGLVYQRGCESKPNLAEAAKWYGKAAEQGFAIGENNLAVMYLKGEGVMQDVARALHWFHRSVQHGYAPAQKVLDTLSGKTSLQQASAQPHDHDRK